MKTRVIIRQNYCSPNKIFHFNYLPLYTVQKRDVFNKCLFQIILIATFVAYSQAGIIGAPAAYSTSSISFGPALAAPAYAAPAYAAPAYAAPTILKAPIAPIAPLTQIAHVAAPTVVKAAPSVDYVVSN